MSSLIEQAARRLAQLRQAGAEIPEPFQEAPGGGKSAVLGTVSYIAEEGGQPAGGADILLATPDAPHGPDTPNTPVMAGRPPATGARSKRIDLDLEAIAAAGMVSPTAPRSQIADQYRIIKRPLLENAAGRGKTPPVAKGNLIMVTSALPREGKTFTAVNLALSIATELDNTVMLVDADVARPSLLELLGVPPQPGLLDLLQDGSLGLSDTLIRTNVDKLTLLPSGMSHPRATELLASDAMVRLLNGMAGRYPDRIIIFDSPPLLVTTESHVLATHMGQVVMVVEAERTLESEVMQALATIEACPVKLLMLNKARAEFRKGYSYGYGYALGYG